MAATLNIRKSKIDQQILDAVHRRRRRDAELWEVFSGATLVAFGWLAAAIYLLLTHQVPI